MTACEQALAEFESEALSAELDGAGEAPAPRLRAVDSGE